MADEARVTYQYVEEALLNDYTEARVTYQYVEEALLNDYTEAIITHQYVELALLVKKAKVSNVCINC